jgi:hypothetical protein
MSLEDVKKRFVEEVKLRAYDDKYIDKNEEREILQGALQQGVTVDSARTALAQVCEGQGYVLESRVLIDEKEFNDAVTQCKKRTQGKKNDVQCKRMVVEVIEENRFKVKSGLFNKWYARTKKDVGLA